MQITKEFLQEEIKKMEQQRNHAHDVAVASQAAIDTMTALIDRLDLPEQDTENQNGNNAIWHICDETANDYWKF
jgi:uncharacterized protein YutE (UPF0331/DUF86 family)